MEQNLKWKKFKEKRREVVEKYLARKRQQLAVQSMLKIIYLRQIIQVLSLKFKHGQQEYEKRLTGKFMSVILANHWKKR